MFRSSLLARSYRTGHLAYKAGTIKGFEFEVIYIQLSGLQYSKRDTPYCTALMQRKNRGHSGNRNDLCSILHPGNLSVVRTSLHRPCHEKSIQSGSNQAGMISRFGAIDDVLVPAIPSLFSLLALKHLRISKLPYCPH